MYVSPLGLVVAVGLLSLSKLTFMSSGGWGSYSISFSIFAGLHIKSPLGVLVFESGSTSFLSPSKSCSYTNTDIYDTIYSLGLRG